MKYLHLVLVSVLPVLASSFQKAMNAISHRTDPSNTPLRFYPENFNRAEVCATHYGTCDVDEMEKLADGTCRRLGARCSIANASDVCIDTALISSFSFISHQLLLHFCVHLDTKLELEQFQHNESIGELQGREHYLDTKQVTEMLRTQSKLKSMIDAYQDHHHPDMFDMSDV